MIDYSSLKSIYNDAIDGLLSANGLTVPCSIVYEDPNGEDCPNCVVNPITGRSSFVQVDPPNIIRTTGTVDSTLYADIYILYMDENSQSQSFNLSDSYTAFRSTFPDTLMFVLDVEYNPAVGQITYPAEFQNDDKCFSSRLDLGTYVVKDTGNVAIATDSYQLILDMINDPSVPADVVTLFDNATSAWISIDSTVSTGGKQAIESTVNGLIADLNANNISTDEVNVVYEELFCPYIACNDNRLCTDATDFFNICVSGMGWDSSSLGTLCEDVEPPVTIDVSPPYATSGNLVWFPEGSICPICNGQGVLSQTSTETQNLAVIFDSKKFINFGNVNVPVGDIQIICPITLYPQLASASYITVDTNISSYAQHRYTRISDPQPVGLGDNRYIFSNWERSS